MSTGHCPQCNDNRNEHRHCERCRAAVAFPPFHCRACSRILCDTCVDQGCCGETPAKEWADDDPLVTGASR